jgi:hypothetical protein
MCEPFGIIYLLAICMKSQDLKHEVQGIKHNPPTSLAKCAESLSEMYQALDRKVPSP